MKNLQILRFIAITHRNDSPAEQQMFAVHILALQCLLYRPLSFLSAATTQEIDIELIAADSFVYI